MAQSKKKNRIELRLRHLGEFFLVKEKQHYVPQFYLKNFSLKEGDDFVYCYDKQNKKSFITSTRDICQEINFYSPKHTEESLERAFGIGEGYWKNLFQKIIDAEDLTVLGMEEFAGLLGFLLLIKQRTRKRRNVVSFARKLWLRKVNERFTDWKIVPTDDSERSDHLLSMINLQKEDEKNIFPNNWELIINKTGIPFWASDDPLVQQLVTTDKRFKRSYVKNYFPITPKLIIHSEPLLSRYVRLFKNGISDEDVIANLNQLTFNNAYRFVISNCEILLK